MRPRIEEQRATRSRVRSWDRTPLAVCTPRGFTPHEIFQPFFSRFLRLSLTNAKTFSDAFSFSLGFCTHSSHRRKIFSLDTVIPISARPSPTNFSLDTVCLTQNPFLAPSLLTHF